MTEDGIAPDGNVFARAATRIEKGWCQKNYAVNANGDPTKPLSEDAEKWCLVGALKREGANCAEMAAAFDVLNETMITPALVVWNDTAGRTQREVVDMLLRMAYRKDAVAEMFVGESEKEAA